MVYIFFLLNHGCHVFRELPQPGRGEAVTTWRGVPNTSSAHTAAPQQAPPGCPERSPASESRCRETLATHAHWSTSWAGAGAVGGLSSSDAGAHDEVSGEPLPGTFSVLALPSTLTLLPSTSH